MVNNNRNRNMEEITTIKIGKYTLALTCGMCPEQYDVFEKGKEVAYLRLRDGQFRAHVPFGGKVVYSAAPKGDGRFYEDERWLHLNAAIKAIDEELNLEMDARKTRN
jgi:hypothetical protein